MNKLLLLLGIGLIALLSCKKTTDLLDPSIKSSVDQKTVTNLKKWFDEHKSKGSLTRRDTFQLPAQNPIWDSLEFYPNDRIYTVPIDKGESYDPGFLATLVIRVNETNEIIAAEYTFIILKNAPDNLTPAQVLETYPKVFDFTNMPDNFKATMLKYNMNGELTYSKQYQNNMITDANAKIKSIERLPTAIPEGGIEYCMDSWVIWYDGDTGVVFEIDLESTYCWTVGGAGGGGGNGGGGTCTMSITQAQDIANNMTISFPLSVSSVVYGTENTENGIKYRAKNFTFNYLHLEYPSYVNLDYGARYNGQIYKYTSPSNDPWKWDHADLENAKVVTGSVPNCADISLDTQINNNINGTNLSQMHIEGTISGYIYINCSGPQGSTHEDRPFEGPIYGFVNAN